MKSKTYNLLLILTSLVGYLEWGGKNHQFLFEVEALIFTKWFTDPLSVIHPFILLPLAGQILLLITLFQRIPGKPLTFTGMGGLGFLLGFMGLVGFLGSNYKIVLSTLPFFTVAIMTLLHYRKKRT